MKPRSSSVVMGRSGVTVVSLMRSLPSNNLLLASRSASRSRRFDRLDDVDVAGATADVALDRLADLVLRRLRVGVEQVLGAHQDSGGAVAALERVMRPERLLQGVQLAVARKALHGLELRPVGLDREHHAGLDRVPVQQDRARAAVAGVAADMRPRQLEVVTQEVDEQAPRFDVALVLDSVDDDGDELARNRLHYSSPAAWTTARTASTSARW